MFTPTLHCECAQPGLIDTIWEWSYHRHQTDLLLCTVNYFIQWARPQNMAVGDLAFYYTLYLCVWPVWRASCLMKTERFGRNVASCNLIVSSRFRYVHFRYLLLLDGWEYTSLSEPFCLESLRFTRCAPRQRGIHSNSFCCDLIWQ